jgi:hypothetical protein
MTMLITDALRRARPEICCQAADGLAAAVRAALRLASPGSPILLLYERLGPVRTLLADIGATAWTAAKATVTG